MSEWWRGLGRDERMKPWRAYADRAMHVFPVHGIDQSLRCTCGDRSCMSAGKHPRVKDWENVATSDLFVIEQWVSRWPDSNIGWALGRDGKGALDVDPRNDGDDSFARLERDFGLLDTVRQQSGGGGAHHVIALPAGITLQSRANAFGDAYTGVDFKAAGGYIVVAPSRHASGGMYVWDVGAPTIIQPLPQAWLEALLAQQNGALGERRIIPGIDDDARVDEGTRHEALLTLSGRLAHAGIDADQILATLTVYSQTRFNPPHSEAEIADELRRIADSAFAKYGKTTTTTVSTNAADEWGELLEPVIDKLVVPMLPVELLPPALAPWIVDEAERMSVHPEAIALPALVALGSVIGCGCAITPKREDPGFLVIPSTWGAYVAPPGFLKTPALAAATAPLEALQERAREQYQTERARVDALRNIAEFERKCASVKLETHLRQKTPNENELRALEGRIRALDAELVQLKAVERRYYTNDTTVEMLAKLLIDNQRGLLGLLDEAAAWLLSFDKTGRAGDRKFYLSGWQGTRPYHQDRVGRGSMYIPHLSISIYGGIQPDVMRKYVDQAQGTSEFNDGLLQRFQLLAWNDALPAYEKNDRPADEHARKRAFGLFETLAEFDAEKCGARIVNGIPALRFDHAGQDLFDEFRLGLEQRVRFDEELRANPALNAHLSKYRSLMPAMALLYHLADDDSFGGSGGSISLRAAQIGAAWTEYLEPHARMLYSAGSGSSDYSPTERLMEAIEKGTIADSTPEREVYRRGWRGLASAEQVKHALGPLIAANWGRLATVPTTGRPVEVLRLHPKFRHA